MHFTIFLALICLSSICGFNCDENETKFATACLLETTTKQAYEDYVGGESEKDALFMKYIDQRCIRKILAERLNVADCSEVTQQDSRVVVHNDPEVIRQFCQDKKAIELYSAINQIELLDTKYKKMAQRYKWRLDRIEWAVTCPELGDVDVSRPRELAPKLVDFFYNVACKEEALYENIKQKISKATKKIKFKLNRKTMEDITEKYVSRSEAREEFCQKSIKECCGEELVEKAKIPAVLKAAENLLKITADIIQPEGEEFDLVTAQYEALVEVETVYVNEFDIETDPVRKEQTRLALQLIKSKIEDLLLKINEAKKAEANNEAKTEVVTESISDVSTESNTEQSQSGSS